MITEAGWVMAMKQLRKERIKRSDDEVLKRFRRIPLPVPITGVTVGAVRPVLSLHHGGNARKLEWFLVAAAIIIFITIGMLLLVSIVETSDSRPVTRHVVYEQIVKQPITQVTQNKVVQEVVLENEQSCVAIRWVEDGVSKAKYECEVA